MADVINKLIEQLGGVTSAAFQNDDPLRQKLALAARKVFHELETPGEKTMRLAIEEPVMFSVLQATINMGVFEAWTTAGGGEKNIDELAKLATQDVDPELLQHQMRLLAANHIVREVGSDTYAPTSYSLGLGDKSTLLGDGARIRTDHVAQCAMNWPNFLAKTNYRHPLDDKNSCYVDAYPEKKNFFGRCKANASHQESFSSFMDLWAKQKRSWPQFFDTDSLLKGADLSDGSAFVVDIGGHHGIDLHRVIDKHPNLPAGSLVLEDLPEVIGPLELTGDKIKVIEHDLFTPGAVQPIRGARAYFMHCVLHDWSDESSIQILKQTAAAMKRGYSKVLINDIVIPTTGATCYQTAMDCLVMQASANERTEAVWKKVIEGAGLKFVKIWPDGRGYESVIEAELP
ncbi:putative O-methyltransferase [Phaeosphaeriaceae sp. PMI808]|nr:putative O-methyltransferase [Phaeosphaeriaceae sp. PMI808]KAH8723488.1 putative O-methyltransferase [Phaeosphaeriaceae sp. PMI808]